MSGRWLRAPALHFLAIGAALLAARAMLAPDGPAGLIDLEQLGGGTVDDEILHREALALGLDRRDATVRERLARLGAFVGEDAGDEAALEDEARRLGLERSDVVVRRHLVQMMRLATGRLGPADMPSDAELHDYLVRHAGAFGEPERVRLTHVYVSRDRRGVAANDVALGILAELARGGAGPDDAGARGDAFLLGAEVGPASRADLERAFGAAFARAVAEAPIGRWVGPVASSYGLHLVWIRERVPASLPSLDSVRTRVLHRMLRERSETRARERMAALRVRYGVE